MARAGDNENANPEEFIAVLDDDGNETTVTRQAFEDVWQEKGYSLPKSTKSEKSSDSNQSSK